MTLPVPFKHIAIIPARSGSKGLPNKNIRLLNRKPVLAYSIEAALKSMCFNRIIVSTDDAEIASLAKHYGAEIPFLRPQRLATDTTPIIDVILHTLDYFAGENEVFEVVTLLQPTSPLRQAQDIQCALQLFVEKNADSIISVSEVDHSPLWMNILPPDHGMENFLSPDKHGQRRQQLPIYHRLNGAIYMSKTDTLKKYKTFHTKNAYAYIMPRERSVDIDHFIDFKLCETLLGNNSNGT